MPKADDREITYLSHQPSSIPKNSCCLSRSAALIMGDAGDATHLIDDVVGDGFQQTVRQVRPAGGLDSCT